MVKKTVTFGRQLNIPIIGIIENLSGFVCPKCGTEIFKGEGEKVDKDLMILG